jgi:hypothetical protein
MVTGLTQVSQLVLRGRIVIGKDFDAAMALSVGAKKDQVILAQIEELDVSKLLRLAGEITDIVELQNVNDERCLVFREIHFLMSTGAQVFDIHYDRGIHVKGRMEFFGKKGEFDGQIGEDGVMIKGGVDNFCIGGLEVGSARTKGERATMSIEMSSEKQKILVDGRIGYCGFELSIFIDAHLQEKRLEADVLIQFTENILVHLKAKATVPDPRSLDGVFMKFEGEICADVAGAILDGIHETLDAMKNTTSHEIENMLEALEKAKAEKESELEEMRKGLEKLKEKVDKEVQERRAKIQKDDGERQKLQEELQRLKTTVKVAEAEKAKNQSRIKKLESEKEEVERKFEQKVRDKKCEYERREKEERQRQEYLLDEMKRLEDEKEKGFGDKLRTQEEADRSWKWWRGKLMSLSSQGPTCSPSPIYR